MHSWLEYCINDIVSFSECPILEAHMSIFSLVISILITQSSDFLIIWFYFPLTISEPFVGIHFNIMQISWSSSDFPPSFSIHWWFLTWSMQNDDFAIPAVPPHLHQLLAFYCRQKSSFLHSVFANGASA